MRRAMIARLSFALMATVAACGKKDDATTTAPDTRVASVPVASAPMDHLAPGELVEGKESAFGLLLPRDLKLHSTIMGQALANGDVAPEAVANYIRARVKEGTITIGAMETRFDRVRVPSDPTRELNVRVGPGRGFRCSVQIHDVTRPVLPDMGSNVERYKAAGMTPDGKLIDPQHMQ